jgi:hypothetical protein
MAPAPIAERVAVAHTVILGTVTSIEDKGVVHDGIEYKLAVVKVNEAFRGAKGLTHMRVAFLPATRFPVNSIQKDTDVLLFLSPAKGQTFFKTRMYYDVVNKTSPRWAREVEQTRACAQALENADRLLKEGKPEERSLAAAMLLLQYRSQKGATKVGDAVDATQSKAILLTLADSDWARQDPDSPLGTMAGRNLFNLLSLTRADGWNPPEDFEKFDGAAKKWLKDNADKFTLKKLVLNEQ